MFDKKYYTRGLETEDYTTKPLLRFDPSQHFFDMLEVIDRLGDFDEKLKLISHKAIDIFPADYVSIIMVNPKTQHTMKTIVKTEPQNKSPITPVLQNRILRWIAKQNRSFVCHDITKEKRLCVELKKKSNIRSAMCVPIKRDMHSMGYMLFGNTKHPFAFTADHISWAEKYCRLVAPYICDLQILHNYFKPHTTHDTLLKKYEPFGLIGQGDAFINMLQSIEAAAKCDVRVLLEGESGTGKELVAHAIHFLSSRSNRPFVAVDCGAIPEHLMESELFGHTKGSFTGATCDRNGLFDEANHGTLFIDEISNLPLSMQVKLLRAIQEGEIRPLGSNQSHKVDVRIISASTTGLYDMVHKQLFRQDLYFRLHVFPIAIPSLAQRLEDIPVLANYFVEKFASQQGKQAKILQPVLLKFLMKRCWPGNVRELENFIERLVTLLPEDIKIIELPALSKDLRDLFKFDDKNSKGDKESHSLYKQVGEFERQIILEKLDQTGWNRSEAARQLNISERTIRYKMSKLGINHKKSG